ncbi:hypothetical protein SAMN04488055_5786 [Chitinophaga niabensis]|uniref:Uncharacterized protein n=1 Tax=Chitinophaga niabensis TaxID=536979 RepID=A0A1N6KGI3_9BACT|nr:hypothetical protein SAMN04488055_5786 [Chitinophaga niabensis]
MDFLIKGILAILLNAIVFFGLQFISEVLHFTFIGKYSENISLVFVVAQIAMVVIIYWGKWAVKDLYVVLLSIILVLVLYFLDR